MRRYHSLADRRVRRRRKKLDRREWRESDVMWWGEYEDSERSKWNYNKNRPFSCRIPKCPVCHWEKLNEKDRQEVRSDEDFKQQMDELGIDYNDYWDVEEEGYFWYWEDHELEEAALIGAFLGKSPNEMEIELNNEE